MKKLIFIVLLSLALGACASIQQKTVLDVIYMQQEELQELSESLTLEERKKLSTAMKICSFDTLDNTIDSIKNTQTLGIDGRFSVPDICHTKIDRVFKIDFEEQQKRKIPRCHKKCTVHLYS